MQFPRRRRIYILAGVVFLCLAIGVLLPMLIPARLSEPPSLDSLRRRNIWHLSLSLIDYAVEHSVTYPYSEDGGQGLLELLANESPGFRARLTWVGPGATVKDKGGCKYLYLNPGPTAQLTDDTVILIEADFYYADRNIYAVTASWETVLLENVQRAPAELLGKDIDELGLRCGG